MTYSLEPSYRRYVHGHGFVSFAKNIRNKYGRKRFDKSKDFAKIAGKKVLTKSAEATGDLTGNKIVDRITKSTRNKAQKEDHRIMEETQEMLIPPENKTANN